MAFIPDLDGVEAAHSGPPQAPPGEHLMVVKDIEEETKENKNIVHTAILAVMAGEHAGKIATQNFTVNHDVGKKFYKGFLEAIGFTTFKGLSTQQCIGKPVMAWVAHETFDGKKDGKKITLAKAVSFRSGQDAFKRLVEGASSGGQPATPAGATAGASQEKLGF